MIQSLSEKYQKHIAYALFAIFYLQLLCPSIAAARGNNNPLAYDLYTGKHILGRQHKNINEGNISLNGNPAAPVRRMSVKHRVSVAASDKLNIGGPNSPEASHFKAVGSDNLVNLFNGSFSYSIPLLDLDGYPVNLFYSSGITMDQDASWVGLGWNINPGAVNRDMRGVPDDFDGTDMMTVNQDIKPNKTWGANVGADVEVIGIKSPADASFGVSYNNYLGPAMDLGINLSASISILKNLKFEKSATEGLTFNLDLSSRSGFTIGTSYNAKLANIGDLISEGVGLSTGYNSRTGIKSLTISGSTELETDRCAMPSNSVKADIGAGLVKSLFANMNQSSTISFAKPSYMPSLRMPMENSYTQGQVELGGSLFLNRGSVTADGYACESEVPSEWQTVKKPLVGYMYYQNANNNEDAVMDFTRMNDGAVTPNTPIISAPAYSYDIFTIQGEGTGGTIRAYRSDLGFVRDNVTESKDKNLSLGADFAPGPQLPPLVSDHFGANVNTISAPTRVGGWEDPNGNTLKTNLEFQGPKAGGSFENIYFKNPGEGSVVNSELVNRVGGDNLVKFQLDGDPANPVLESNLQLFDKNTRDAIAVPPLAVSNPNTLHRDKRTQVITMLNAHDASVIGLDKSIKNYGIGALTYTNIPRVGGYRSAHHISEIDVLEQNGMRYVYGLPVYNITQKDFSFSIGTKPADPVNNLVQYSADEPTLASAHLNDNDAMDGYLQTQQTPAYASSFLLTGLLSPDYVDVTGDGITEDDQGTAVKFNYTMSPSVHAWRTPRSIQNTGRFGQVTNYASFNEGLRSEQKDDKATITFGEREVWYLNTIESKSMVAVFTTVSRQDGKGVQGPTDPTDPNLGLNAAINSGENANKELVRIDVYTKASVKANGGFNGAKPIKTIKFNYSYNLCKGSPDNSNAGKLTLESIEFSYNGQTKANKEQYVFNYGDETSGSVDNPAYAYNSSDRWGNYKPPTDPATGVAVNPSTTVNGITNTLTNIDYPYTSMTKPLDDQYASAWSLKKILLPSGGQIEVNYEANDYAYVQDRKACNMFTIAGLGSSSNYTNNNRMFIASEDNYYVYIKLPQALQSTATSAINQEIYSTYLQGAVTRPHGLMQLAFKLQINMPNGVEPLTTYADIDYQSAADPGYGVCSNDPGYIYVRLSPQNGESPLSNSAIGFITGELPDQAFPGYAEPDDMLGFIGAFANMFTGLITAFNNVDQQMRMSDYGSTIVLGSSFIRLDNPAEQKFGGYGARVKRIVLKDNWDAMTSQYLSQYGQDYDYTTTEITNGVTHTISSGVASYEPGIGSEENPFREIISFDNKTPLASAMYGAIEMPVLDALYPAPSVGYSKITVRSIHRNGTEGNQTVKSAIGKQVTEYYTAKDYPTYSNYSTMTSLDYNTDPFFTFFYKKIANDRAISQGFIVETNDMHGKIKSQASYSESDENTPVSSSYHSYINTGQNGLNDKVDFVYNDQGGVVCAKNAGVDMELMTDVREFSLKSTDISGQAQVDITIIGGPPPSLTFAWVAPSLYGLYTYDENIYHAVTCTKLINYHAIEDNVTVTDKGSVVNTKTIAYDAETGIPLVSQTANEYNDAIYTTKYPAYWAYSGVGPAYKNIGMHYDNVNFSNGKIQSGVDASIFESGDELYITKTGGSSTCIPASTATKIWVFDINKGTTSLTVPVKNIGDLVFMDAAGNLYNNSNVSFTIVRSGKRNNLDLSVATATSMQNPIQQVPGSNPVVKKFFGDQDWINSGLTPNVVAASAVEYKEKWAVDCAPNYANPYTAGILGNFKPYRSYTYYGSRNESDFSALTDIRKNGYVNNFSNYWNFNSTDDLVPNTVNSNWVWNSELTQVSSDGKELETKDALNRYTAALYGYSGTLPIAVTQNAQNQETYYNGFEDNNYDATLDGNEPCGWAFGYGKPSWNDEGAHQTANVVTHESNPFGITYNFAKNSDNSETLSIQAANNPVTTGGPLFLYTSSDMGKTWTHEGTPNNLPPVTIPISAADAAKNLTYGVGFISGSNYSPVYPLNNNLNRAAFPHTGSNMLLVPANDQVATSLPFLASTVNNDIQFNFGTVPATTATTYNLTTPGLIDGNIIDLSTGGTSDPISSNSFIAGINTQTSGNWEVNMDGYFIANGATGLYLAGQQYPSSTCGGGATLSSNGGGIAVYDMSGNIVFSGGANTGCLTSSGFNGCMNQDLPLIPISGNLINGQPYKVHINLNFSGAAPCQGSNDGSYFLISLILGYSNNGGVLVASSYSVATSVTNTTCGTYTGPIQYSPAFANPGFRIIPGQQMLLSAWVQQDCNNTSGISCNTATYSDQHVEIRYSGGTTSLYPSGPIINGWQKVEGTFTLPVGTGGANLWLINSNSSSNAYFDDVRIHPYNANMKSYVYDPFTLRLISELDENNYATFYDYDEEGQLIRVKKETTEGVKTINEARKALQKGVTTVQ